MRVEGARLVAVALSTLGHGALIGWLAAGIGEAVQPAEPITVALVVETPPAAAAAPAAAADPAPPAEARAAPPVEPAPPTQARAAPAAEPTPAPMPAPQQVAAVPAPQPAPAPLAKPTPAAIETAPSVPQQLALVEPAAGGAASSALAAEPAPAAAAPSGNAVAALSPKEATPLAGGGNAPPVYPLAARRQGIQGRVILDVAVDAAGRATEVKVGRSSGSRLLDDAALDAVRGWRFTPATVGGVPIASKVQVPVTFRLDAPG